MQRKYNLGYTQGVFDMFHVGHLNLIKNAQRLCNTLIVGVNSDSLVQSYKNKKPVINERERVQIVNNIKGVKFAEVVDTLDKMALQQKFGFDVVFIGDDWKGTPRWNETEKNLNKIGVEVIYLPYTMGLSSTELRNIKDNRVE